MVADISDCCSLEFAKRSQVSNDTKVLVVKRAPDASFKGDVCKDDKESSNVEPHLRLRRKRLRSEMFVNKTLVPRMR